MRRTKHGARKITLDERLHKQLSQQNRGGSRSNGPERITTCAFTAAGFTITDDDNTGLNNNGDNSIRLSTNALRSIYESGFNTVINKIDSELEGDMERLERINGQVKKLLGVS